MTHLARMYKFPKRLGLGGIKVTTTCSKPDECLSSSKISHEMWYLEFAKAPPQFGQPFRDIYDYTLKVFSAMKTSNHSISCFEIEFHGYSQNFYYFLKHLLWIETDTLPRLGFNGIEFHPNSNYLLQFMSRFVEEIAESPTGEIRYPQKINTCLIDGCPESAPKAIEKANLSGLDVIIPTRGVEVSDIERCLESVISDIKDVDRIILVDDNIEPLAQLAELQSRYSSVEVHRGSQMGVAAARNVGLLFSRNELVAFVDSDDFVLPGYLEVQRLFHQRNISVAATGTWLQAFGAHTAVYSQWENFGVLNCLMCLPPAGVLMWKKSVLNELRGFDEQFGNGFEDFHLVARASNAHYVIAILDSPLYRYQRGHVSLSQSWTQDQEQHLRSKINSLARNLCEHQFQEIFNLISSHGNLVLLSHPDFVFEINRNRFLIVLGKIFSPGKYRNNKLARVVWSIIPRTLRYRLFKFVTHLPKDL